MASPRELLVLHAADDVAVALADLPAGPAKLGAGAELMLAAPIPLGHKVARHAIAAGAPVRKYGAVIGEALAPIAAGEHVHVHNLRSLRARGNREEKA
jgi:altronate dehydratase